jgi:hypothetical protein
MKISNCIEFKREYQIIRSYFFEVPWGCLEFLFWYYSFAYLVSPVFEKG